MGEHSRSTLKVPRPFPPYFDFQIGLILLKTSPNSIDGLATAPNMSPGVDDAMPFVGLEKGHPPLTNVSHGNAQSEPSSSSNPIHMQCLQVLSTFIVFFNTW